MMTAPMPPITVDINKDLPTALVDVQPFGGFNMSGTDSKNPCIGKVSDMIVSLGGSVILSEFPELVGGTEAKNMPV